MVRIKERLNAKKNGSGLLMVMILVFFLITFIVTVGEFYRIHIMQQEIEIHLQRAINCSVEYAMGDSYRQDKSNNRKYKDGKLVYRLEFVSVNGTSNPAVFNVKGYASARSLFSFLTGNIEIPFDISSTNFRTD